MNLAINCGVVDAAQESDDVCALPLMRRLGATLDRDVRGMREGDAMPRGWHLALFSVDTPQSQLRADGLAGLGIQLPELGLPRIVFGGRRVRFHTDIPIGAHLTRVSRLLSVVPKTGRSGRFALVTVQHEIFLAGSKEPAITELLDYVMREAALLEATVDASKSAPTAAVPAMPEPSIRRIVVPDELLLFRVSAVMFNPHRIHYDLAYASKVESYPSLVVNGSVTSLLLLEFYREESGTEPDFIKLRNNGLSFCGHPIGLNALAGETQWQVWADDEHGSISVEGVMGVGHD
jgi:3-methylfumaryl-CoA hydratase